MGEETLLCAREEEGIGASEAAIRVTRVVVEKIGVSLMVVVLVVR